MDQDYARLAPTAKQIDFARAIAARLGEELSFEALDDRRRLSDWISARQGRFANKRTMGATSRQVAYAEKLARRRRTTVPEACFRDAGEMSRWIDRHR